MKYEQILIISKGIADKIDHYLTEEPCSWEECLSEDETITYTVDFPDGKQMDVKCCGVQFQEDLGVSNLAWTEAVLFDENGSEICCTEPCEDFFGEWECESDGNEYIVNVVRKESIK